MGREREEYVKVPLELLRKVDEIVKQLDFENREAFVEAAVRRLVDYHLVLQK